MLTKREQKETIDVTIGRIRGLAKNIDSQRLLDLINKLSDDVFALQYPFNPQNDSNVIAGVDFSESLEAFNKLKVR